VYVSYHLSFGLFVTVLNLVSIRDFKIPNCFGGWWLEFSSELGGGGGWGWSFHHRTKGRRGGEGGKMMGGWGG